MNRAGTLGLCLYFALSLGAAANASAPTPANSRGQDSTTGSQSQPAKTQSSEPAQASPAPSAQQPNSASPAKPAAKQPRRHKKTAAANCPDAPAALNPAPGSAQPATPAGSESADAGKTQATSTQAGSGSSGSGNAGGTNSPPCPPAKKVVRNGGSDEPKIELVGGATAEQAARQRSTDQLRAATEENLKKIAGRQLTPAQQEMVSQIKQFLDQSKVAVDAGDLERGHNLALKAKLLSDELTGP